MVKCQQAADQIKQSTGNQLVDPMQLDLSSFASIGNFAQSFKQKKLPLNYLINNAGVYGPPKNTTEDGFEVHLGTNHLGPFYLTYLLTDVLKSSAPSRIVNVGAHGHKMGTRKFSCFPDGFRANVRISWFRCSQQNGLGYS
jgi:NAD(P)-dependent dehydrogenase (short-subunit alcohol dehydrogenase family)